LVAGLGDGYGLVANAKNALRSTIPKGIDRRVVFHPQCGVSVAVGAGYSAFPERGVAFAPYKPRRLPNTGPAVRGVLSDAGHR
jgi:hypothetical protein